MKKLSWLTLFSLLFPIILPSLSFAFTSECSGGAITYSAGKVIHTFTSSGTLNCSGTGGGSVSALVVGGGGGGGNLQGGGGSGGGGGGGYQYQTGFSLNSQSYSVTIGAGGLGGDNSADGGTAGHSGFNGGDSIFSTITAVGGGGGGGGSNVPTSNRDGQNGGSGGGSELGGSGGTGSQGSNGGVGDGSADYGGGGGGGAGGTGSNGSTSNGGNGGNGLSNSISGASVTYAGGGGGGIFTGGIVGSGGSGGGGTGTNNGTTGGAGTANTGGGGGGVGDSNGTASVVGGAGGSGIVIISYATSTSHIEGSGTLNKLAKFSATTTLTNALLSDDGSNTTLTSGNFFMPLSSLLDSITTGALNFGTTYATTMVFGRSGQNMVINSKVGIATSTPATELQVNGTLLANIINVIANGLGFDTYSPGTLSIGSTTASAITIGRTTATTTVSGPLKVTNLNTVSNCSSTTTPSTCGSAPSGSVAMPTGVSTLVINTTAVTANSQIFITEDSSLGSRLGITCNTGTNRNYSINARVSGTSFTIKSSANPTTNKACLSYFIVN